MQIIAFFLVFSVLVGFLFFPFSDSFGQSITPPRHQWKKIADVDQLACNEGLMLLQKSNGAPACVSPASYLRLIDRGYGMFDSSMMNKRPAMTELLIKEMASNSDLMSHWHEMMNTNPKVMQDSMKEMVSQMKGMPNLLDHVMHPMITDPELRTKMIELMKSHPYMEETMRQNEKWMSSVHMPMNHGMDKQMGHNMNNTMSESMTHNMPAKMSSDSRGFSNSTRMMDMIHHMWIDSGFMLEMHQIMLENPNHMNQMSNEMMGPLLGTMMDDPEMRQKMIKYLLEHEEFMNSIRHEN